MANPVVQLELAIAQYLYRRNYHKTLTEFRLESPHVNASILFDDDVSEPSYENNLLYDVSDYLNWHVFRTATLRAFAKVETACAELKEGLRTRNLPTWTQHRFYSQRNSTKNFDKNWRIINATQEEIFNSTNEDRMNTEISPAKSSRGRKPPKPKHQPSTTKNTERDMLAEACFQSSLRRDDWERRVVESDVPNTLATAINTALRHEGPQCEETVLGDPTLIAEIADDPNLLQGLEELLKLPINTMADANSSFSNGLPSTSREADLSTPPPSHYERANGNLLSSFNPSPNKRFFPQEAMEEISSSKRLLLPKKKRPNSNRISIVRTDADPESQIENTTNVLGEFYDRNFEKIFVVAKPLNFKKTTGGEGYNLRHRSPGLPMGEAGTPGGYLEAEEVNLVIGGEEEVRTQETHSEREKADDVHGPHEEDMDANDGTEAHEQQPDNSILEDENAENSESASLITPAKVDALMKLLHRK